jgi:signal transduction histidine kinase
MEQVKVETFASGPADAYDAVGIGTRRTHACQFYEDDAFLLASAGDFLARGLAAGQAVVAVATAPHRAAFQAHFESRGFDVERATARGQLALVDADELLATFMDDRRPHPSRFRSTVGALLLGAARGPQTPVRVFGEMVDILCRNGNIEGAIELEKLWNDLARKHRFSLLCGYSMSSFSKGAHGSSVSQICDTHAHVLPTERYQQAGEEARLREIALLQQRAQALAGEIEHREELERSLREALGRAEAASRAKSEFLAVMSHELRTPLNAIGGHVQLMEMGLHGPVTDQQRDALGRVQRSQRHLLALINDVLNLARTEAGQVVYVIESLPVAPVVAEVTSLLAPLFAGRSLSCNVAIADSEPLVARADHEKVHQILLNLLGNAIKFTPDGGCITVQAGPSRTSPAFIDIDICDTGIGIPADRLEAIFEPFVQLGARATGPREGVGLGLSISRTLARGMGGNLVAQSGQGVGSTLTLSLPRDVTAYDVSASPLA